jgi:hypothetical protein
MQDELFSLPPGARHEVKARKVAAGIRYLACRTRHRTLCDDCVEEIHVVGFAVAPPPRSVRWRRIAPDGTVTRLCGKHRAIRQDNEG